MKTLLIPIFILFSSFSFAQTLITGTVLNEEKEPLPGSNVVVLNTTRGTLTDTEGAFKLNILPSDKYLVISYVGYLPDTVDIRGKSEIQSILRSEALDEIVVKSSSTFVDQLQPITTVVITEKELTKAACCNLSESFETNASVDVSFSDAVTGAKQIQMLGLDGIYVQINRENIPNIRGLTARYGLGFIPGTWIQSIDVGKGAGSVMNGYESMTGQINVELKKPESMEKLYLNGYVNEMGRTELNVHGAQKISDKITTGTFLHGNYFGMESDRNSDGFVDIPKSRQLNFLNRWKYSGDRLNSQIGFHYVVDDKAGGQLGFGWKDNPLTANIYGYSNKTERAEIFGKIGILFPEKPYKGIGILYSGSVQELDAEFGRKSYLGKEKTFYSNVIYQSIIDNSFHTFKTGFSYLYDDYEEVYNDSLYTRTESVPGLFLEYTYSPAEKLILVAGARNDFHNIYGNQFSPRLHIKYDLLTSTALRLSAGKGFRVPNAIAENTGVLVSSRDVIVTEEIKPEVSWNYGATINHEGEVLDKKTNLSVDYFYTNFENRLVVDMDRDPSKIYFTNLDGRSFAHSFQTEVMVDVQENLDFKVAYKYYDVKSTLNNEVQQVPFISKHRFFGNIGYATKYDIWKFDLTGQWYGPKRLPNTEEKPEQYQLEKNSPAFFTFNGQVNRAFRWGEIYFGAENILNYIQETPIVATDDPFGPHFDASMSWGPLAGRMIYAGFKYKMDFK